MQKQYGDVDIYKQKGVELLKQLCDAEQIPYDDIAGRLKSPYRIWKKLKKYQTTDIGKIMDILAFRIVTKEITDCYNML